MKRDIVVHFANPDHLAFLLIFIFMVLGASFQSWGLIIAAIVCWIFAFAYDIAEEKIERLQRLKKWLKEYGG
jgi:hypothetical protein